MIRPSMSRRGFEHDGIRPASGVWGRILPLLLVAIACRTPAPGAAARLMAVLDADGDLRLSGDELAAVAHPSLTFAEFDADGDGQVDIPELDALLRAHGPLLPDHAGRLALPEPAATSLAALDTNGDARLSPAEWQGDGFADADLDRDGAVNADELRAWIVVPR